MAKKVKILPTPDLDGDLTLALLGKAIRARRTQGRLRLEDAAALCGVAKQTLMNIEKGLGNSEISTVLQVCSGLGIELRIIPWTLDAEENDGWD